MSVNPLEQERDRALDDPALEAALARAHARCVALGLRSPEAGDDRESRLAALRAMRSAVALVEQSRALEVERRRYEETGSAEAPITRSVEMLADTLPQMVWITRPDGYHKYYNRYWFEYTGLTYEEAKGTGWNILLHPDDVERSVQRWTRSLQTGEAYEVEYRFRRASDGAYRWFLGRALPRLDEDGTIIEWFGTCTDIHDQKSAQEAMRIANVSKDQFLAMLSHELRTPLNAILGWTQLMTMDELGAPERARALDAIERNAKLQAQLIEDILDASRITNDKLSIEKAPLHAHEIVDAALATAAPLAAKKDITLDVADVDHAVWIEGDAARFHQIVSNLLANAIKFTPRGGRVSLRFVREDSRATLEVTDTGQGIDPEFLPHVFERFRQADSRSTRGHGGLGLGLTIVKSLVELHGGDVEARSDGPGQGATFRVRLPVLAVRPEGAPSTDSQPMMYETMPGDALVGVRCVLVDDEPSAREVVAATLRRFGAEVRAVARAADALEALEADPPHVLVSDIAMPETSGYDLIRSVRAHRDPRVAELPALALTAYASVQDRREATAAGFDRHLPKPVEANALVGTVKDLASV